MIKFTPLIFLFIDMTKITRTFDILTNAEEKYNYDDFISIKSILVCHKLVASM